MKRLLVIFSAFLALNSFVMGEPVKKISVTGNVEKEILPNMATLHFEITGRDKSLTKATEKVNQKLQGFKATLKAENIGIDSLETESISDRKIKVNGNENNNLAKSNPTSYTAEMKILVKNVAYDKIGELIEINEGEKLKSITKKIENYNDDEDFDDEDDSSDNQVVNIGKSNGDVYEVKLRENDKTLSGTLNKLFAKINFVNNKLQKMGSTGASVSFGGYEIRENYGGDLKKEEEYEVTHKLNVVTKNLKDLNTIIALANKNDLNIVGSIKFDLSNRAEIESEMYNEAYNQAKQKAASILKSSNLKVGDVIVVSEDVDFQQKMIDRMDENWTVAAAPASKSIAKETNFDTVSVTNAKMVAKVDYAPKPLKLTQNISVMYEMLEK
nr:SIMPL domain-containing protein [uncultured Leptotrichia sp.]